MSKLVGRLCRICGKGGKDDEVREHEKICSKRDACTSPGFPSLPKTPSGSTSRTSSKTQSGSTSKTSSKTQSGPSSKTTPLTSSKTPLITSSKTPTGSSSKKSPGAEKESKKQKVEVIKTPTPKANKQKTRGQSNLDTAPSYSSKKREKDSLPSNALRRNSPKQAWNARLPEGVPGKLANPFPGTKSFRYYPVACEFCHQVFHPGTLRKHIQTYHPDQHLSSKSRGRGGGKIQPPTLEDVGTSSGTKPTGGIPKQLKICYICGGMFGSKSLPIHEPKCLEKWRLENNSLPPNKRRPEPVKLSVSDLENSESIVSAAGHYANLPDMNPEAEAAYRSHLKNLVPCTHCKRTFNPDRIMVHENVCVERAKKRVTKIH